MVLRLPDLVLQAEQKLHILTMPVTATLTMQLQRLKALLLRPKLQQLLLLKALLLKRKLQLLQLKVLHQRPKLLLLKLQHQLLKAMLLLQKQSSWTSRCI